MRVNDDKDMAPVDRQTTRTGDDEISIRRQRALYRAEHRGTREMDFLLGRFARASLNDIAAQQLSAFEQLLDLPDPVLAEYLIDGRGTFPPEIMSFLMRISHFHNNKN